MVSFKSLVALLVILVVIDMFVETDAWRRRRRRRRPRPPVCRPPTKPSNYRWYNDWDKPLTAHCGRGATLGRIRSLFSHCHKDRVFSFACHHSPVGYGRCYWTRNYVNSWRGAMNYVCPNNGFVAGVHSVHNNAKQDRVWKFKCCHRRGYYRYHCYRTGFINSYRSLFHYKLPYKTYLAGVSSYFNSYYKDRRWRLTLCRSRVRRCHWYRV